MIGEPLDCPDPSNHGMKHPNISSMGQAAHGQTPLKKLETLQQREVGLSGLGKIIPDVKLRANHATSTFSPRGSLRLLSTPNLLVPDLRRAPPPSDVFRSRALFPSLSFSSVSSSSYVHLLVRQSACINPRTMRKLRVIRKKHMASERG